MISMEKATGKVKMNNKFLSLFRLYACATLFEEFFLLQSSRRDENFSNVISLKIGKLNKETEKLLPKAYAHHSFSTFGENYSSS